jgi:flagellar basal-body rod protein FlgC
MSVIDPIKASMSIAGSGLEAQSSRLRVVSENIANVDSTGRVGGADPYRRRTITFDSVMSRTEGVNLVRVKDLGIDNAPFRLEYEPGHQAADENGYVKRPNVNVLVEMSDMRETNRSYEANLQIFKQARAMAAMTIDMLKASSS